VLFNTTASGQYTHPDGLVYGGSGPEWSNRILRRIVDEHLAASQRVSFIDWHTGIGEYGEPFFLCFNDEGSAEQAQAAQWWGAERVRDQRPHGLARPDYQGLVFRGVAFEFRFKADEHHRRYWDLAFVFGSVTATFFQGVTLGAYIEGITVVGRAFHGGAWDWISPFSLFTGVGLVVGYALLGCTWLIMKTEGRLHRHMCDIARPLTLTLLAVITVLSVWTPLAQPQIAQRWFSLPNMFWFFPVPVLVAAAGFELIRRVRATPAAGPFMLSLALVFLAYTGLGISIWPAIIPPDVSIWTASAPPQSQGFALVGALLIIPIILAYTAWSYYVFRGKVRTGEEFH